MSLVHCHPANPSRPVDWRWRTAAALAADPHTPCGGWDDGWVWRAVAFHQALHPRGGAHHPQPVGPDPALAAAYALRCQGDHPARWRVEALLLASEDDDPIAARCGVPADAVAAYERVFFDVRAKLHLPSYVMHQAIHAYQDRPESDTARAWKLLGYSGGPRVVDFLSAAPGAAGGTDLAAAVGPSAPRGRHARLVRLAVAALTVNLDATAARRLGPLLAALDEADGSAAPTDPTAVSFAALVAGLVLPPGRSESSGRTGPVEVAPLRRVGS